MLTPMHVLDKNIYLFYISRQYIYTYIHIYVYILYLMVSSIRYSYENVEHIYSLLGYAK